MHLNLIRKIALLILVADITAQGVSTIKYFHSEDDFLRGAAMKSSDITDDPYIQVLYNSYGQMISKSQVVLNGEIHSETIFEYAEDGSLRRKSERNEKSNVIKMYVYGAEEMSEIFIGYAFPQRPFSEFQDRVTIYSYDESGDVTEYLFKSIDNYPFGAVRLSYFEGGLPAEERWILLPEERTMRLFDYDYDPTSRSYALTEYDSTGTKISQVGLVLPTKYIPELYELLSGSESRSGNVLEESDEILDDIHSRLSKGWNPSDDGALLELGVLTSPDLIYLTDGDTLEVTLVDVTKEFVRFMFFGENELLTMPIFKVQEIERRDGKVIYPVIY
ncbi:MAG TPA: hypothetical protein EYO41_03225 [Candidatus Marinimicrobia bacterium]|jgi:hypothetical protein|nr:hypothetical protein [Candidatus Neomarinimicrobiota bacterium]